MSFQQDDAAFECNLFSTPHVDRESVNPYIKLSCSVITSAIKDLSLDKEDEDYRHSYNFFFSDHPVYRNMRSVYFSWLSLVGINEEIFISKLENNLSDLNKLAGIHSRISKVVFGA